MNTRWCFLKGRIFLLFVVITLSTVQADILNFRKSKQKDESSGSFSLESEKPIAMVTEMSYQPKQFTVDSIPKPNSKPLPESEKIIVPINPPTDSAKPQVKQTSQFHRPFNQKLVAAVSYCPNPENPHKGVIFRPVDMGSVIASMEGRVVAVDYMDGYYNYVIIEHLNGFFTVYGNLDDVFVAEGQTIRKGEALGSLVKEKGLYFQVNHGKKTLDPISLIKS